jgi:hypothetical protein
MSRAWQTVLICGNGDLCPIGWSANPMNTPVWLDWLTGGLAIVIVLGGLLMLFRGVSVMGRKD